MTTDIVERLRLFEPADKWEAKLVAEAANEIKWLRIELGERDRIIEEIKDVLWRHRSVTDDAGTD